MNLNPATVLDPAFHFSMRSSRNMDFTFFWRSSGCPYWCWPGCSAAGYAGNSPINRTFVPASALSYSHTYHHRPHRRSSSTNMTRRMMTWITPGVL